MTDDSYDEGSVTTDPAAEHASLSEAAEELAVAGQLPRFLLMYKFAIEELMTKLRILSEEFDFVHRHDPIEHITSRVKRPEAIKEKVHRRGLGSDWVSAARALDDIAGIRVVCPFVDDVFAVARMLTAQDDVELLRTKDYIARPKANGYRSLHLIVRIPVFLSDRVEKVKVEVQLRTIAMDFWAAVEHKLSYKYRDSVPRTSRANCPRPPPRQRTWTPGWPRCTNGSARRYSLPGGGRGANSGPAARPVTKIATTDTAPAPSETPASTGAPCPMNCTATSAKTTSAPKPRSAEATRNPNHAHSSFRRCRASTVSAS